MNITAKLSFDDERERRNIILIRFDTKESFHSYIDNIFHIESDYTYNCITTTSDNKILLFKRKNSFALDILNKLITINKNIIEHLHHLSKEELNLIKITVNSINNNINESDIKTNLFRDCCDMMYVKKIYKISYYLSTKEKLFFDTLNRIDKYMKRKVYIHTNDTTQEIMVLKNKNTYMLPGGRKSKLDTNFEDTVHRETYEELGRCMDFSLYIDTNYIIHTKILDKLSKKEYKDLTFICKINKSHYDISEFFRPNREVSSIKYIDSSYKKDEEVLGLLVYILRNIS